MGYIYESGELVHQGGTPTPSSVYRHALTDSDGLYTDVKDIFEPFAAGNGILFQLTKVIYPDSELDRKVNAYDVADDPTQGLDAIKTDIEINGLPDRGVHSITTTPDGKYLLQLSSSLRDNGNYDSHLTIWDIDVSDLTNITQISDTAILTDESNILDSLGATNNCVVMVSDYEFAAYGNITDKNSPTLIEKAEIPQAYGDIAMKGNEDFVWGILGQWWWGVGTQYTCFYAPNPDDIFTFGDHPPPAKFSIISGPSLGAYDINEDRSYVIGDGFQQSGLSLHVIDW
jgi:hypothetical protein